MKGLPCTLYSNYSRDPTVFREVDHGKGSVWCTAPAVPQRAPRSLPTQEVMSKRLVTCLRSLNFYFISLSVEINNTTTSDSFHYYAFLLRANALRNYTLSRRPQNTTTYRVCLLATGNTHAQMFESSLLWSKLCYFVCARSETVLPSYLWLVVLFGWHSVFA